MLNAGRGGYMASASGAIFLRLCLLHWEIRQGFQQFHNQVLLHIIRSFGNVLLQLKRAKNSARIARALQRKRLNRLSSSLTVCCAKTTRMCWMNLSPVPKKHFRVIMQVSSCLKLKRILWH